MTKSNTDLRDEIKFLEEQANIRKLMLSIEDDDDAPKQLIRLEESLVRINDKNTIEYETTKRKLEIDFLREKLRRMKILTWVTLFGVVFCISVTLTSLYIAYLNQGNKEALIMAGLGMIGFLVTIGSSLTLKIPVSKTELTLKKQDNN